MSHLLVTESWGGNAGGWQGLPCAGANFFYSDGGEIIYFGNPQDVPREIRKNLFGTFRLALDIKQAGEKGSLKYRVIGVILDRQTPLGSVGVLKETVRQYNERYGFNLHASSDILEETVK